MCTNGNRTWIVIKLTKTPNNTILNYYFLVSQTQVFLFLSFFFFFFFFKKKKRSFFLFCSHSRRKSQTFFQKSIICTDNYIPVIITILLERPSSNSQLANLLKRSSSSQNFHEAMGNLIYIQGWNQNINRVAKLIKTKTFHASGN
jgi:hypothetical protein